jgi:hypothetical protein
MLGMLPRRAFAFSKDCDELAAGGEGGPLFFPLIVQLRDQRFDFFGLV